MAGHVGPVSAVAFGAVLGRAVIVSGGEGTLRLWDASTQVPLTDPLFGHTDVVRDMALGQVVAGREVVVSGGLGGTVRTWDAVTRTPVGEPLAGHTDSVTAVAVGSLDGHEVVLSASLDGTVRVGDPRTAHPVAINLDGPVTTAGFVAPSSFAAVVKGAVSLHTADRGPG